MSVDELRTPSTRPRSPTTQIRSSARMPRSAVAKNRSSARRPRSAVAKNRSSTRRPASPFGRGSSSATGPVSKSTLAGRLVDDARPGVDRRPTPIGDARDRVRQQTHPDDDVAIWVVDRPTSLPECRISATQISIASVGVRRTAGLRRPLTLDVFGSFDQVQSPSRRLSGGSNGRKPPARSVARQRRRRDGPIPLTRATRAAPPA
jgi:hypothetical protein